MKSKFFKSLILTLIIAATFVPERAGAQWKSVRGNGKVVTTTRDVPDFTAVKVSCSADVILRQGTENVVRVRTDENLQDMVITEVRGKVLNIDIDGSIRNVEVLEVYVTVSHLQKVLVNGSGDVESENTIEGVQFEIQVNGSGDVDLDLNVKSLKSKISGSGDVEVSGVHGYFELDVSGSGDFDAEDLQLTECHIEVMASGDTELEGTAEKVTIEQSASGDVNLYRLKATDVEVSSAGSGDIVVFVSGKLMAKLSGSGDLTYKGQPETVDVTASGSGDVYHR